MNEDNWDRVLGDIFAAMDRDAAAEGQLIAIAPRLSDEQILRAWAYLAHDDATRWRARSALAGQLHLNSLSRYCETCLSGMMRPMRPRIPRLARIDTRPRFYVGRKGDA